MGKTVTPTDPRVCLKKHPHVRGEDSGLSWLRVPCTETPPRAWGRPKTHHQQYGDAGNTPTCVGKTHLIGQRWRVAQKHPHVRGEDIAASIFCFLSLETPPRAWGRHNPPCMTGALVRNTPTCVGKTILKLIFQRVVWKHPHVRGEDPHRRSGKRGK